MSVQNKFIEKANNKHKFNFDYSKVNYVNAKTKVIIVCPKHGDFEQSPDAHLNSKHGCRKCGMESSNSKKHLNTYLFIEKAKKVHGDHYNYLKSKYKDSKTKIIITCLKHGDFKQIPTDHLQGKGCKKCATSKTIKKTKEKHSKNFKEKANKKHKSFYDYSKVDYINAKTKINIICPKHGAFKQEPRHHLSGVGCPQCGKEASEKSKFLGKEIIREKIIDIIKDRGKLITDNFNVMSDRVTIKCNNHGNFNIRISNLIASDQWCKKCSSNISKKEQELQDFISNYFNLLNNSRDILKGKELDILIPSKNLAIEFNGLYWHSNKFKDKNYHLDKTLECEKQGIRLIHIFEDEWKKNKELVKSRLKGILNINQERIYARKTEVREVGVKEASKFLQHNHIQGRAGSQQRIGLYYNDELVSLMTFIKPRLNIGGDTSEGTIELVRFCSKRNTIVVGGASKLLKYYIKSYRPKKIISYADLRWSQGNVYEQLGFNKVHTSKPNYFYTLGESRENRFKYRKDRLVAEGFDPNKSERQIMEDRGFYRIYDCGTIKYSLIP